MNKERSHWRDERFSTWHRSLGDEFGMTDCDGGVWAEWKRNGPNDFRPVALIEYKHERALKCDPMDPNRIAIKYLCNQARICFFEVRYEHDFRWLAVTGLNLRACEFLSYTTVQMSEKEYVLFMTRIRL